VEEGPSKLLVVFFSFLFFFFFWDIIVFRQGMYKKPEQRILIPAKTAQIGLKLFLSEFDINCFDLQPQIFFLA
jgi:hypothetical protein